MSLPPTEHLPEFNGLLKMALEPAVGLEVNKKKNRAEGSSMVECLPSMQKALRWGREWGEKERKNY
jgi:hypothetical protein